MARRKPSTRRRRPRKQLRPAGLAPGTIIVDSDAHDLSIQLSRFGADHYQHLELASVEELAAQLDDQNAGAADDTVTWVDVVGQGDAARLARLGEILHLHPLAIEDIANTHQRPKVEPFGNDLMIFGHMMTGVLKRCEDGTLDTSQLALLMRRGLVVTFRERPGPTFEPVRQRIEAGHLRLRNWGADYLAYALLDAMVDEYVHVLDHCRDQLEHMEDLLLADPTDFDLQALHLLRRDLIAFDRQVAPFRDAMGALLHETPDDVVRPETRLFLRDCHDHAIRTIDRVDTYQLFASSLMEFYLSMIGYRSNEVMKVLAMISTIFIPLSFLAGLYGMNFDHQSSPWNMPELHWRYGYPAMLAVMLAVGLGIVAYFRRQRWF
jgi:magnesium transporter